MSKPNIAKWLRTILNALTGKRPAPPQPQPTPEPVPEPVPVPPAPIVVPRATGADLLTYRGWLGGLRDSMGRVVWTPALPGAFPSVIDEWLSLLRNAGVTHVPIGPFGPGPAYPGIVSWDNPDWRTDAASIRGLVETLLSTPSADGKGFRPVIFTDGGPRNPRPRLASFFPVLSQALEGLDPYVIVMPAGWEPVVGDFSSADVSWALETWHAMRPNSVIGYHGSPTRLVGSSNPLEPDDPWQGGESIFYTSHGGEFIQIALYQTPHGDALYRPCTCPNAAQPFGHEDECWLNRFEDYVARIGTGFHDWRVLPLVLFEVSTYEVTRGQRTPAEGLAVVRAGKTVADKWSCPIGYGDGIP